MPDRIVSANEKQERKKGKKKDRTYQPTDPLIKSPSTDQKDVLLIPPTPT
jgi:hypothetical protein